MQKPIYVPTVAVVGFSADCARDVLVLSHPMGQAQKYFFPIGLLHFQEENILDCAARELRESVGAGFHPEAARLLPVVATPNADNRLLPIGNPAEAGANEDEVALHCYGCCAVVVAPVEPLNGKSFAFDTDFVDDVRFLNIGHRWVDQLDPFAARLLWAYRTVVGRMGDPLEILPVQKI